MTNILPPRTKATPEEKEAVQAYLKQQGGEWVSMPPDYTSFSRDLQLRKHDDVREAVVAVRGDTPEIDADYEKGVDFINTSHDFYQGKRDIGRAVARAFVVPMFSNRIDDRYAPESTPFLPLLDPDKYAVNSEIRMRTIYGLPPTVLDTYTKSTDDNETGALVLMPLYRDMTDDIRANKYNREQQIRLMQVGLHVMEKTAQFAHLGLGAKTIGLAATLPRPELTNFGQVLKAFDGMDELVTTTGHGGTVYTVVETARKVIEEMKKRNIDPGDTIGVIGGAGSIGWSSTIAMIKMLGDYNILSYDRDEEKLLGMVARTKMVGKIAVANDALQVMRETNVFVSAITKPIDLDKDDPDHNLDLKNKFCIDDSQPAGLDSDQVGARGGRVGWVVVEDGSENGFMTRDGFHTGGVAYNYGSMSGLVGEKSEFACSWEAGVIGKNKAYHLAIDKPVTPKNVEEIGKLMDEAGARVAPFQAFGKPVNIN